MKRFLRHGMLSLAWLSVPLFLSGCAYNQYMAAERNQLAANTQRMSVEEQRRQDLLARRQSLESQISALQQEITSLNAEFASQNAAIEALQRKTMDEKSRLAKLKQAQALSSDMQRQIEKKKAILQAKQQELKDIIDKNV